MVALRLERRHPRIPAKLRIAAEDAVTKPPEVTIPYTIITLIVDLGSYITKALQAEGDHVMDEQPVLSNKMWRLSCGY